MERLSTIAAILFLAASTQAQNVGIGTDTPHPSAKLEIASDTSGVLVPRMTAAERDAIMDPETGLLVFVTSDSAFYYFDGTIWTTFDSRTHRLVDADRDTRVEVERTPDDDIIRFVSRDSQVMIIDSTGHIGIGDTMPDASLSLRGGNFLQTPVHPVVVGSVALGNSPRRVHVAGRYAYIVDFEINDLKVVDVADPDAPAVVGSAVLGTQPLSLYVSGRYAYVVDNETDDLKVVDVSDPTTPTVVGSVAVGTNPQSVYVSGPYAYVVDAGSDDLKVIDVADPTAPDVVGSVAVGTSPNSVYVSRRYAYVVDSGTDDLKVVDVADPSSPAVVGSVAIGTNPNSVYVSGRYAYVVDPTTDDLKVVDASDPTAPAVVGSLALGTQPLSVYVSGRYAYVVDSGTDDLKVVDVVDPASPAVVGSVAVGTNPQSVYVSGRYAYLVDTGTDDLKVIDVSGGEMTSLMAHSLEAGNLQVRNDLITQGQLQVSGGITAGSGGIYSDGDVGVSGDLSLRGGNFLQTPVHPTVVGSVTLGNSPRSIYVSGRYAYVVDELGGILWVVDVSDPSSPTVAGGVTFFGSSLRSVYVSGRYAYVVDNSPDGLKVVDVSDPSFPTVVGSVALGTDPTTVYVSGRYAYVVDSDNLKVVDVSDPSSPTVVGSVALGTNPESVYVSSRYAFVVDSDTDDLKVVDVSDPSSPTVVGSDGIGTEPRSIYVSGRYAFVVDQGSDDLKVVDVSDPSSPTVVGSVAIGTLPESVYVSGRYAFVVDRGSEDLKVVDVSDPSSPTVVGSVALGTNPVSVYVSGRYAYVVGFGSNDLKVVDVSGGEMTSLMAHSLEAGNLQVRNDVIAQGQLQVSGGITAGSGGIYSDGDVGISGDMLIRPRVNPPSGEPLFRVMSSLGSERLRVEHSGLLSTSNNLEIHRDSFLQNVTKMLTIGGARAQGGVAYAQIDFENYDNDSGAADYIGASILSFNNGAADDGDLRFSTNDGTLTTKMTITPGGSVGIGTTAPAAQLHTTGGVRFSNFGPGSVMTDGLGNLFISSDERLKVVDSHFETGVDAILRLNPVNYKWNDLSGLDTQSMFTGFSAQNVRDAIPEAVGVDARGYLTLSDRPIVAALVNAVKELHAENQALKKRNETLTSAHHQMRSELDRLHSLEDKMSELQDLVLQSTHGELSREQK